MPLGVSIMTYTSSLYSELFMRLSYYMDLGYGKKLLSHMGIEPRSFQMWAIYSTPRPEIILKDALSTKPQWIVNTDRYGWKM